jgi:hypothetical protein
MRHVIPSSMLQHRVLEQVVFQWDGTHARAMEGTTELAEELRARGGILRESRFETNSSGACYWFLTIERVADGQTWEFDIRRGDWVVIDLHEQRVYTIDVLPEPIGEETYNRTTPVIRIETARPKLGTGRE